MKERDYHICKVEVPMYERYDRAVENNDAKELAWFAQFGTEKWESQMITNARAYEQYLLCGYKGEPVFNEHGWLENGRCLDLKEKSELVPVFKDDQYRANVMILQHPNGKWIATAEYNFTISGGGAFPSIWCKQYPTRRDALNAVQLEGYNIEQLEDVYKALCYITGTNYDHVSSLRCHHDREAWGEWFVWGFFRCKAYKKGTMHFEFLDEDVWYKFNYEVAKQRGWALPKKIAQQQEMHMSA